MPVAPPPAVAIVQPAQQGASEPMRADGKGRPVIGAMVDGKGPFDMVVDTAAQSTIMKIDFARAQGLVPTADQLGVVGVAGREAAAMYPVKRLSSRLFDVRDARIPAVSRIGATEAQAILGMDLFAEHKLVFDRAAGQVRVEPSGPTAPGFVAVRGTIHGDTNLFVPIVINGVEIMGLVDSGAEGSVAGPDMLRALGWASDDPRLRAFGQIRGATAGGTDVRTAKLDTVKLGPVTFREVPMVFTSRPMATPDGRPMMILGLDMLNLLQAYAVDFPRAELQIGIPRRPAS